MRPALSPAGRTSATEEGFLAFERRWDRLWFVLPYLLLGFAFLASMTITGAGAQDRLIVTALSLALIVWHFWFINRHPHWPEHRLGPMAIYFIGLLSVSLVLSGLSAAFTLVVMGCYPMAFVALPGRWAYAGVALTGAGLLVMVGMPPGISITAQLMGASALAAAIGWAIRRIESEAIRRREAHQELDALQRELSAAAHEAGVSAERARLARDFHDTLAQGLAGIGAQLEHADAQIAEGHPASKPVRTALALSRASLTEARRSVHALRPGPLSTDGLLGALRSFVGSWQDQHAIPARLEVTGAVEPTDAAVQTALLRFAQEGLANIARHAGASQATITLSAVGDQLMIDIFDDGDGFDVGAVGPGDADGGFGLIAARERLAAVGGELSIESTQGTGTTVTAIVPAHGGGH